MNAPGTILQASPPGHQDPPPVSAHDEAAPAPARLVGVTRIGIVALAILAVFYTLYFAASIILPFLLAMVLNLLLQPVKRIFDRLHVPAPLTALLLIVVLFSLVAGIGFAISLPASGWAAKAPQAMQTLEQRLGALRKPIKFVQHGVTQLQHLVQQGLSADGDEEAGKAGAPGPAPVQMQQPSNLGGVGMTILAGTRVAMGQLFTLVILLFFLLTAGDSLLRNLVEVVPDFRNKKRVVEIANAIERNISGYLATITVINLIVGVVNGLAMWLTGVPDALLFGTLAFLLNYIPIIGPLCGVVIFFFVGLFSFSSLGAAFIPPGIYLLVHMIEGETITPMLLARRFTLNPVLVIVSLFFWDWLWGITGALLSLPLLAIAKIVCDRIPMLEPLGHMLGVSHSARRQRAGHRWRRISED